MLSSILIRMNVTIISHGLTQIDEEEALVLAEAMRRSIMVGGCGCDVGRVHNLRELSPLLRHLREGGLRLGKSHHAVVVMSEMTASRVSVRDVADARNAWVIQISQLKSDEEVRVVKATESGVTVEQLINWTSHQCVKAGKKGEDGFMEAKLWAEVSGTVEMLLGLYKKATGTEPT